MTQKTKPNEASVVLTKIKDEKIEINVTKIKKIIVFSIIFLATLIIGSIFSVKTSKFINLEDLSKVNNADCAFIIISSILVMLMTPALALFYGGMVRTFRHSFDIIHPNV